MSKKLIYSLVLSALLYGALYTNISLADSPASTQAWIVTETHKAWVTAYASVPEETDDTPFTTAIGTTVHDGIIATNFLPIGTKVKIPALFGDKIFTVEDRMAPKRKTYVDVWMSTLHDARAFGIHAAKIEVVEEMDMLATVARN